MSSMEGLQQSALDHLWLHFTDMGGYKDPAELQVIVRGDGCHLWDAGGRRYLDALAGLFCVNIGYGYGEEMGEAAAAQMRELPFAINWTFAHPRSIELAEEIASLTPGDLDRVFFVSGGAEAIEAAWKLARQYHSARGERRWKAIARRVAYHGTTMGALSINGCTELRTPFEPLVPDVLHVHNTNRYHRPPEENEEAFTRFLLEDLEGAIEMAGPETVAMVVMEPVQNAGGSFMPPEGYFAGVREICDRHGILLCADEVITGFGRVGEWFASERFDIRPDLITSAKGLSSAYAAIGALIASERVMEPFSKPGSMYTHGMTFGGHPVQCAVALKNIEIMKRDRIVEHVREKEADFHAALERAARAADRRRPARRRLLLCARARQGQGDARVLQRGGVRGAAARLCLAPALPARADLPGRRPRRSRRADLTAARGGAGGDRHDRRHPRRGARGGRRTYEGGGLARPTAPSAGSRGRPCPGRP